MVVLVILDGWGIGREYPGNAVFLAETPNFDFLGKKYPNTRLAASGKSAGLLGGMFGNSETGHLNIGGGRVVEQDVKRISSAIKSGDFYKNPAILKTIETSKKAVHLMGLLSDAGVHSLDSHLFALLKMFKGEDKQVYIHIFTDGRDTPIKLAEKYIRRLERKIKKYKTGEIATVSGRYYSMDRDKRWQRTEKAFRAISEGKGEEFENPLSYIKKRYRKGETDEFIIPACRKGYKGVEEGDGIIFFNFRSDRPRQLTMAFLEENFPYFPRERKKVEFCSMKEYYKGMKARVAFSKIKVPNCLGEVISQNGGEQIRIAETEKEPHITYFFNGLKEEPFSGEKRVIVPSPKVATYDLKPEMSAFEITEKAVEEIKKDKFDFMAINFANPDMVGHTGDLKAGIKAVETTDKCLGKIVKEVKKKMGVCVITADHGNAEEMRNKNGEEISEHSANPVPFVIVKKGIKLRKKGKLADVALTILEIMKIKKPTEMSGKSLIIKSRNSL